MVYAKRPFAGPEAVLTYLSRYTHRMAIANSRLVALDERGVTFKYKDYRCKGSSKHKTMALQTDEFIRRFMLHILPSGFHRIRHYGLLASQSKLEDARRLLDVVPPGRQMRRQVTLRRFIAVNVVALCSLSRCSSRKSCPEHHPHGYY